MNNMLRFSPAGTAIIALAIAFSIAFGLDLMRLTLREQAAATFQFQPVPLLEISSSFVLAAGMLAITWLLFVRLSPSRVAMGLFLATGLLLVALQASPWLPMPLISEVFFWGDLRTALLEAGIRSNLFSLSSFCATAGLVGLLFPNVGRRHAAG